MAVVCFPNPNCGTLDDSQLYSLEDAPLIELICQPGFDCSQAQEFHVNCCGNELSADLSGMTAQQRTDTINGLLAQCTLMLQVCGGGNPPFTFYLNTPQKCSVPCADGTLFTYTVPAGVFAADSLVNANALAFNLACQRARIDVICLGVLPVCACVGLAYSAVLKTTSPTVPGEIIWSVNGSPPPGITFHTENRGASLLIDGTPTVFGVYTFIITARRVDGSFNQKSFTVKILEITTLNPPGYTVGVPYFFQMLVVGGSGNYLWKVLDGSLPSGLSMSNTGLISGTPTM